jgi:hypothetical protein
MRTSPWLLATIAASISGCVIITDDDATLTIHNHSDHVLVQVHLADDDDRTWGPNLLPDVLHPGEDLVIDDISCGRYDVLVVDDENVECELRNLDLCFHDEGWVVDNTTLALCAFRP